MELATEELNPLFSLTGYRSAFRVAEKVDSAVYLKPARPENLNGAGTSSQDAGGLLNDILLNLISRLRHVRHDPPEHAIADFRSYVASTAYNACNLYLRRTFPRHSRLKNRLRYLLELLASNRTIAIALVDGGVERILNAPFSVCATEILRSLALPWDRISNTLYVAAPARFN